MVRMSWQDVEKHCEGLVDYYVPLFEDKYDLSVDKPSIVEDDGSIEIRKKNKLLRALPFVNSIPRAGYIPGEIVFQDKDGEIEILCENDSLKINYDSPVMKERFDPLIRHELGHTAQYQNSNMALMTILYGGDKDLRAIQEAAAYGFEFTDLDDGDLDSEKISAGIGSQVTEAHDRGLELVEDSNPSYIEQIVKKPENIYEELTGKNFEEDLEKYVERKKPQ